MLARIAGIIALTTPKLAPLSVFSSPSRRCPLQPTSKSCSLHQAVQPLVRVGCATVVHVDERTSQPHCHFACG